MSDRDELSADPSLYQLGDLVKGAYSDQTSPFVHARGRRRMEQLVAARPARRLPRAGWVSAALVAALGVVFVLFWPSSRLEYTVDGARPGRGAYLQAANGAPATAHFTDGTDVRVAAGARARITDVDSQGARIALEHGRASFRVVHRKGARWSVDAGPFSVAVTGTEFDVEWSGGDGTFQVELRQGSVIIQGPLAPEGIALAAGQRFVATLGDGRMHIDPLEAPAPAAAPVAAASALAGTSPPEPPRTPSEPLPQPSWTKRVAAGDFDGVLSDAQKAGVAEVLRQGTLGDLVALSDAARYRNRTELARSALLAQRKRFPASTDARSAAFLLGRLAENGGANAEALEWYERYLGASPNGAFAAEALGRKMLVVRQTRGPDAARSVAREYSNRFPGGPYAARAAELASRP